MARVLFPLMVLLAACCAAVMGCAGSRPPPCGWPEEAAYRASQDSLGLADFRALPAAEKERRRAAAADWRAVAEKSRRLTARLRALRSVVGLVPDDASAWLRLGRFYRWTGDRAAAAASLDAAAAAFAFAPPEQRKELRLRVALERAWLHRDAAEWDWGLAWIDSAATVNPRERETRLLQGLLLGERGGGPAPALVIARDIAREGNYRQDATWISGLAYVGEGRLEEAYAYLRAPDPLFALHRADQLNDSGLICEELGNHFDAERFYREAGYSLPERDASCLKVQDLPLRDGPPPVPTLPVWIAFDRFYCAGSLYAYARLAARNYASATAPAARTFWGDAAVGSLSTCIRRGAEAIESRSLRGRLFLQMELLGLAEADLTRALTAERQGGGATAATLAALGLLRTKGERYGEAVPLLHEAVALDSTLAPAWGSLGYALVMTGKTKEAQGALDRALALDPALAAAWYNRGLIHLNAGELEPAVADLQHAVELAPGNVEIAGVLRRAQAALKRRGPAEPPR